MDKGLMVGVILALTVVASGCADSGQVADESNQSLNDSNQAIDNNKQGFGKTEELVKEGNILKYDLGDETTSLVFYNETEDSIMVTESGGEYGEGKIYKGNWSHSNNAAFLYTLYSFLNGIEEDKIEKLMEKGEDVKYEEAGGTVDLARSSMYEYKGFDAYNITYQGEGVKFNYVFTSKKPYVLLKADLGGTVLEFIGLETTDSPKRVIES